VKVVAALLVAVAVLGSACGRKAPPIAPELVRPEPATDLAATPVSDGVRLTWTRPLRYSGGQRMNDLGHFTIERAAEEGAPFVPIATVEVTDQERFRKERHLEWTDRDVRPGEHHFYRVTAVTLDGYRSAPAGPVAVTVTPPATAPPPR
jgi:hypothetical protein